MFFICLGPSWKPYNVHVCFWWTKLINKKTSKQKSYGNFVLSIIVFHTVREDGFHMIFLNKCSQEFLHAHKKKTMHVSLCILMLHVFAQIKLCIVYIYHNGPKHMLPYVLKHMLQFCLCKSNQGNQGYSGVRGSHLPLFLCMCYFG